MRLKSVQSKLKVDLLKPLITLVYEQKRNRIWRIGSVLCYGDTMNKYTKHNTQYRV